MTDVISVRFRSGCKEYYFDPKGLTIPAGTDVIVETAQGPEFAHCAAGNHQVPDDAVVKPLRSVLRIATDNDKHTAAYNRSREKEAFDVCKKKIQQHKLEMKLVRVECSFDGSKILFFFTADGRVDFRELVKDLAGVFRARIELRQIGVRDEAKMIGGLGICGRPFCCAQFMDEFLPVSIKMAKTQNLSLNPTKISGTCGRLMCCLKYEQDAYEDAVKRLPKNDSFVLTPDGTGNVSDVNVLKETVNVRLDDRTDGPRCYHNCEVCVLRNGKGSRDGIAVPDKRPERYVEPLAEEELPTITLLSDFDPDAAAVSAQVDEHMAVTGQVTEQLSEHQMEGFLEGYLLTGRHGIWSSYESFVHVIDSMLNQHAKWLEATVREIPWRKPISSMNLLVSSHVWRQDHNGFSHQDPGVTSVLLNKCFNNDHVIGIYFPVDSNMLLAVAEKCYKSTNKINAIIAGKQPAATWLTLDEARAELEKGAAEWKWASNVKSNDEAQIVLAATGDVPTQEIMAAADKLDAMGIKFKVVNVVDLVKLQSAKENNEALSDEEFAELFTEDKPVLFAYHSYARDVRGLIYDRPNHDNFNVHGYEEQGSTTTPYDMVRVNNIDRYELVAEALRMIDADKYADKINELEAFRQEAFQFAVDNGYDHPDYTDWVYSGVNTTKQGAVSATAATAGDNE